MKAKYLNQKSGAKSLIYGDLVVNVAQFAALNKIIHPQKGASGF
jgi:hypothetical protein